MPTAERKCKVCGCTDMDCRRCVAAQGFPCWWVKVDLCSRCWAEGLAVRCGAERRAARGRRRRE